MRLCYSLLAFVVVLLANCDAAANDAKVSRMVSTYNSKQFARVKAATAEKRFLRSEVDDKDPISVYQDDEERGLNPFKAIQDVFKKRQQDKEFEKKALQTMFDSGGTPDTLFRALSVGRKGRNSVESKLWKAFKTEYEKING